MTDRRSPPAEGGIEIRLFEYSVADGATNMARDEAMMSHVAPGRIALRFYGWEPWCLSLGRNQPAPELLGGRRRSELTLGTDLVRRPTGGRSVFHGPEVTYAFACSDQTAGGPKAVYQRIQQGLEVGLAGLGVGFDLRADGRSSAPDLGPDGRACFRDPAPSELTVDGRKLVGSAQWRHGHVLLQHGSILLDNLQRTADLTPEHADLTPEQKDDDSEDLESAVGLSELLHPPPSVSEIVTSLSRGIEGAFRAARPAAPVSVQDLGATRVGAYRSAAWGWRR